MHVNGFNSDTGAYISAKVLKSTRTFTSAIKVVELKPGVPVQGNPLFEVLPKITELEENAEA